MGSFTRWATLSRYFAHQKDTLALDSKIIIIIIIKAKLKSKNAGTAKKKIIIIIIITEAPLGPKIQRLSEYE